MADEYGINDKFCFLVLYIDANKKPSHISRILDRFERTIRDWISKIEIERGINILEI